MTIYALSSGPGISGVAVIRLSGQDTSKVIQLLTGKEPPKPRVATLRKINKINTSELIDEGLILWFPGPESYTGEDMAEIQVHGSKAVVDALHSSLSDIENCRLAEPGEFTKIAFQNDKIDLLKAESIGDLIHAETELQRDQAVKLVQGNASNYYNDLREKLIKSLFLATKSVSEFTSTATPFPSLVATATSPSAATRLDFFAALANPLVLSQSIAASKSPSVSVRAFLASIMPAPVVSRSSFTIEAVIAMIHPILSYFFNY